MVLCPPGYRSNYETVADPEPTGTRGAKKHENFTAGFGGHVFTYFLQDLGT